MRNSKLPEPEVIYQLYHVEKKSSIEIAKIYKVRPSSVIKYMYRHNIPTRNLSEAFYISKTYGNGLAKWQKENFTWNKGLTKKDPKMAALIEKGRQTQIRNGKSSGKNNPMYGKVAYSKSGFRKDLGHATRSSWEANFAKILNFLHINYQYEKFTFALKNGETYTPDFYLPDRDKFYEIKGYEFNDKFKRFINEYPNKKLVIINEKFYNKLIKKFGNKIILDCMNNCYSKNELIEMYKDKSYVNVSRFCKEVKISRKYIIKIFGSINNFNEICKGIRISPQDAYKYSEYKNK